MQLECDCCTLKVLQKNCIICECNFTTCKKCLKTYLLSKSEHPHCMNCKKEFSRFFLCKNISKNFVNTLLKKHQEKYLITKELMLLPETQQYVENEMQIRKHRNILNETLNHIRVLEYSQNKELISILRNKIYIIKKHIRFLKNTKHTKDKSNLYVQKCPTSNCKGYLIKDTNSLFCELCKMNYCYHCNELYDSNHTCNHDTQKSVQEILQSTTPCPQCGLRVYKSDGCSQIWCIYCKIAFDFETGLKEKGIVHNPSGVVWLQQKSNENIENFEIIQQKLNDFNIRMVNMKICKETIDYIFNLFKTLTYLKTFDSDQVSCTWSPLSNRDIRIKFMINEYTLEKFASLVQRRSKQIEKNNNILSVIIKTSSIGLKTWYCLSNSKTFDSFQYNLTLLNNIIENHNVSMKKIHDIYNCICPFIDTKNGSHYKIMRHCPMIFSMLN